MNDRFSASLNLKKIFNNYKRIESNIKYNNQDVLHHRLNNLKLFNENNNLTKIANVNIAKALINHESLIFYNANTSQAINKSQIQIILTTPFMSNININSDRSVGDSNNNIKSENNANGVLGFFEVSSEENCVDVNKIMYSIGDWTLRLDVQVLYLYLLK